jgi:transposase InsO family protein
MSAPGQATENARAESFFKTVKYEEIYVHRYQTFEEAQAHLQTFLEEVYPRVVQRGKLKQRREQKATLDLVSEQQSRRAPIIEP